MRLKNRDTALRIFSAAMLAMFMFFIAGATLFTHRHTVDGVTFAHSHPFACPGHAHSGAQLISIAQAAHLLSEEAVAVLRAVTPDIAWTRLTSVSRISTGVPGTVGRESLPAPPASV